MEKRRKALVYQNEVLQTCQIGSHNICIHSFTHSIHRVRSAALCFDRPRLCAIKSFAMIVLGSIAELVEAPAASALNWQIVCVCVWVCVCVCCGSRVSRRSGASRLTPAR